ncbi:hypothetical protein FF38_06581 [Lucilia cuprina]|uniref:Uncharacterized protein n=1 Tax=Lucilia cuprina TaxID=7375 RepID=A0A0L0CB02_LUCCU|nr:hypothetical protein FF38_06581 [Lucilia cuprina]
MKRRLENMDSHFSPPISGTIVEKIWEKGETTIGMIKEAEPNGICSLLLQMKAGLVSVQCQRFSLHALPRPTPKYKSPVTNPKKKNPNSCSMIQVVFDLCLEDTTPFYVHISNVDNGTFQRNTAIYCYLHHSLLSSFPVPTTASPAIPGGQYVEQLSHHNQFEQLRNIINHAGKFAVCWKIAYKTPILKKREANNPQNYRPIAIHSE